MKRLIAILMALLLYAGGACAEKSTFTFRNGLHWGMTPEEVQVAEGKNFYQYGALNHRLELGAMEDMNVSKFTAYIGYLFTDNQLMLVIVAISDQMEQEDVDYLLQAMNIVYGAGDASLPAPTWVDAGVDTLRCAWEPEDGTYIALADMMETVALVYVNTAVDLLSISQATPTPRPIVTTGL